MKNITLHWIKFKIGMLRNENWRRININSWNILSNMSTVFFRLQDVIYCVHTVTTQTIDVDGGKHSIKRIMRINQGSSDFIDAVVITGGEPLMQSLNTKKSLSAVMI